MAKLATAAPANTMLVRINPYNPQRGYHAQVYLISGSGLPPFDVTMGWYEVDADVAESLMEHRNNPEDPLSPPVFQVLSHEEAIAIEELETRKRAEATSPIRATRSASSFRKNAPAARPKAHMSPSQHPSQAMQVPTRKPFARPLDPTRANVAKQRTVIAATEEEESAPAPTPAEVDEEMDAAFGEADTIQGNLDDEAEPTPAEELDAEGVPEVEEIEEEAPTSLTTADLKTGTTKAPTRLAPGAGKVTKPIKATKKAKK